ncbi:MAG: DHHA1 domain-containing protein [Candidatus Diapherotrites archaeon]|nr:DHHA1 domain-containing protein [Candidatus Diapherotrites archaeon]
MPDKQIKRFKNFLDSFSSFNLFYHGDADGLCSAVIFSKAVEKLCKTVRFAAAVESPDALPEFFQKKRLENAVILDIAADSAKTFLEWLSTKANVLIIDHHKAYNDFKSEKVIIIKPQTISAIEPSSYPASKLCFDLCSTLVNLEGFSWVASVGIIGDFAYKKWASFVETSAKSASVSVNDLEQIADIITSVQVVSPNRFPELLELFMFANPKAIIKSDFDSLRQKALEELALWKKEFYKNAEFHEKEGLYFFTIKPKYRIKSMLIDSLTKEIPDKTIIIAEDLGGYEIRFSARRQDFKVPMNSLLENAIVGIKGATAGGHIPAAAGKIPREKLLEFKEKVISFLRSGKH